MRLLYYLLPLCLLLAGGPALAQQLSAPAAAPTPAALVPPPAPAAAPDTVAAIHRLFAAERRQYFVAAGFFGVLGLGATRAYANTPAGNAGFLLVAATSLPGSAGLLARATGYSRRHEQLAIAQFEQRHYLAPAIQAKLRPWHFAQPKAHP